MPDAVSSVRGGYDRWAAVYDHDANPLLGLEWPVVRAAVGDTQRVVARSRARGHASNRRMLPDSTCPSFSRGGLTSGPYRIARRRMPSSLDTALSRALPPVRTR